MYAVIETGGKQYRIEENSVIDIERIEGEEGSEIIFDQVLLVGEGEKIECGTPRLEGTTVEAKIVEQFRGKKLTVFKMKRRKGYRKKHGHRQELTKVEIVSIKSKASA